MEKRKSIISTFLFVLLTGVVITSCDKDDKDTNDIVGSWTVDSTNVNATVNNKTMLQYFTDLGLSPTDAQTAAQSFDQTVSQAFSGTINFKSDGTYTSTLGGQDDSGKWTLNDNKDKLTVDSSTDDPIILNVTKLTNNHLVLGWADAASQDINNDNVAENIAVNIIMYLRK
jgi:hypothetical protein